LEPLEVRLVLYDFNEPHGCRFLQRRLSELFLEWEKGKERTGQNVLDIILFFSKRTQREPKDPELLENKNFECFFLLFEKVTPSHSKSADESQEF
tara:strand:+ start:597 stop:881 length:285 start_codon:yes stop_codon:yes gene_type:complete